MTYASPRAVAIRILTGTNATTNTHSSAFSLAQFQLEAVAKADSIIRNRGGVIIADSVGLGKTYIAAALIERLHQSGPRTAVVIPSALANAWRRALKPLHEVADGEIRLISHGQLSRGFVMEDATLVVVDEAHAFRNPATRRYRSLRLLCRGARVVLLTATPVNNSLADLYWQLRLFANDDAFRDLGVGSIRSLLQSSEVDVAALQRLRNAVVIRRSRNDLRDRFPIVELPDGQRLQFPASVSLHNVDYRSLLTAHVLRSLIERLSWAAYGNGGTQLLMLLSLLKRIQSGKAAAIASTKKLLGFQYRLLEALEHNRWLRPRSLGLADDQLFFPQLIEEPFAHPESIPKTRDQVRADRIALLELHALLESAIDDKLDQLATLLKSRSPPNKTLIFTEFRDTAEAIWRSVVDLGGVGMITGHAAYLGLARSTRWEVISRFAPEANRVATPARHESVHTLIATDVLAEGMNLQDADTVISYDLPWNPVRLIQRAGRIDRIGSNHTTVHVYNFLPDREFDEFVGIVRTLRRKLDQMRSAVGLEAPVLHTDDIDDHFLAALRAGESTLLHLAETPGDHPDLNPADAAPSGCCATTSRLPGRILFAFEGAGVIRMVMVIGGDVREDPLEADAILARALERPEVLHLGDERQFCDGLILARSYLERSVFSSSSCRETAVLAGAIHAAIRRMGLLAPSDVVALADDLLRRLNGFVGVYAEARQRLRSANTPAAVRAALVWLSDQCRSAPQTPTTWQFVGAIASD